MLGYNQVYVGYENFNEFYVLTRVRLGMGMIFLSEYIQNASRETYLVWLDVTVETSWH